MPKLINRGTYLLSNTFGYANSAITEPWLYSIIGSALEKLEAELCDKPYAIRLSFEARYRRV